MLERRIDRIEAAEAERQAGVAGAKDWLLREIRLIRERRAAAEARLPESERAARAEGRRAHRAALADRAPTPEEAERLAARADATGDLDDTRRAMLAAIRLIVARSERERLADLRPTKTTPRIHDPQTPPTAEVDR